MAALYTIPFMVAKTDVEIKVSSIVGTGKQRTSKTCVQYGLTRKPYFNSRSVSDDYSRGLGGRIVLARPSGTFRHRNPRVASAAYPQN